MFPIKLKATLGRSYNAEPEDVVNVKQALNRLGYYELPEYGLTPYGDTALFDGIKRLQRDRKLSDDGIVKPGGETEASINALLRFDEPERSPTLWCSICGAPHGGVYSPRVCPDCWKKYFS